MRIFSLLCLAFLLLCPVALAADSGAQTHAQTTPAAPAQPQADMRAGGQPPVAGGGVAPVAAPATSGAPAHSAAVPASPSAAPAIAVPSSQTGALLDRLNSGALTGYFGALGVLFLVLAILWGLASYLRRKGGGFGAGHSTMRLVGRLSLGPKKWLVVVDVYGKRVALGVTDEQVTFLTELDTPENTRDPLDMGGPDRPCSTPSKKDAAEFAAFLTMDKP